MNINNYFTFTKSSSFTNSNTHTNTYTIASTNTNTHTNKPYIERLTEKAFAKKHCQNFVSQGAAYFRWMSFSKMNPSTLPGWLLCLPGRNPNKVIFYERKRHGVPFNHNST